MISKDVRSPITFSLVILVGLVGLGWGLVAPTTRFALDLAPHVLDGATFTVARGTWTGLAWLPIFIVLLARERRSLDRQTPLVMLALGAIWGPGVMGLYAIATAKTALAHVVFSVGLTPVAAGLLSILAYGGTIDRMRRVGLGLGVLGVMLLGFERSGSHATLAGDAFLLGWIVAFGAYATVASGALRTLSPLLVTAAANVVGGALLASTALVAPVARRAIVAVAVHPGLAWPFFGGIVLFGGFVAPLAYAYALGRAPVAIVTGGAQYLSIVVGVAVAMTWFREPFGPLSMLAGIVLVASLSATLWPIATTAGSAQRSPTAA
ncbi:MAG: hypothetical protein NVS4B5_17120 [Vulcanimicrobiaceae bacterium]